MKKLLTFVTFVSLFFIQVALSPLLQPVAQAASCQNEQTLLGIKPWYHNLCKSGSSDVEITDPGHDTVLILLNIIGMAIGVAGYGAVGFVIWGGIKYIIANGDSGKIASAKSTIQNALIGLGVALSAVAIVTFVGSIYT